MIDGTPRTLVVGLGNPLLRDDAVGLRVVQALRPRLEGDDAIELVEDYNGGLRLMERMVGYDRVVVVDAIVSGAAPGTLHSLRPDDRPTRRSASSHDVDLTTALALGRQAGAALPADRDVHLVGIEAVDVLDFGEALTAEVAAAVPRAVELVLSLARPLAEEP